MSPRDDEPAGGELEGLIDELWHGTRFTVTRRGFRPPIDVVRTDEPAELRVIVDLAGVDPGDVHIVVNERALVIAGQRSRMLPDCRPSYHLLEIEYGPFERRIALPENVDPDGARATSRSRPRSRSSRSRRPSSSPSR